MFYVYFMPCIVLGAMYLSSVVLRGKCCVMTWLVWCIMGHDTREGGIYKGQPGRAGSPGLLVYISGRVWVCVWAQRRGLC